MNSTDRKAAVAAYKEKTAAAGVYAVRCAPSGQVWVGESRNLEAQQTSLWFAMRLGSHPHRDLVEAWAQHGEAAFSFEVLETLDPELSPTARATASKEAATLWREELKARPL
jgi:hypothetical protein